MTLGFLLALAAGFVWSWVNVIDKTVVSKFIRNPIFIVIVLCAVSFLVGLGIIAFGFEALSSWDWAWLIVASIFYTFGGLFYFYALKRGEPSRIVPLFGLISVFIVFLSAIFLGEIFGFKTYFGIFIITVGSVLIMARQRIMDSFSRKSFWLMVVSCLGFAVAYVINKHLLFSYTYWQVFGWQRILVGLVGVLFLIFYFSEIKQVFQQIKKRYIGLSAASEILSLSAHFLFTMASAFWFVTLVSSVSSVGYVFLFVWALIISRFKPSLFAEEVNKRVILQKVVSIALIIVGIYLIT